MLLQSLLRPVLTPLMRGMFDAPIFSSAPWSPLALWPNGIATPGMWISPRTLTSEWQYYTGTTPVAEPGTVADSSNPVGLALDIRAGAPEVLGPELVVNGDFSNGLTGWNTDGNWSANTGGALSSGAGVTQVLDKAIGTVSGKYYRYSITVLSVSGGSGVKIHPNGLVGPLYTIPGTYTFDCVVDGGSIYIVATAGCSAFVDNISVKEIPGNHMLQSTSAARPLLSAYDGQTLGPGDTYDSAGYPIAQLYDGVDDSMATAAFSAGTLIDGMDCLIAVRRDSAAKMFCGLNSAGYYFGNAESGWGVACFVGCGTPTVWVDGVQLAGGTAVTADTLNTALTVGDYHILEFRDLTLSTWTSLQFGVPPYAGYAFNGPRGDILLYPSTASTTDKDAARQWLADYYGVTLP